MSPKHKTMSERRPTVNWAMQPTCPKGEIMSLMPYASDPEGLYECIQRSSEFGIPIYVSETGFPTFNDDHMQTVLDRYLKEARPLLIRRYLYLCASVTGVRLSFRRQAVVLLQSKLDCLLTRSCLRSSVLLHLGLCSDTVADTSPLHLSGSLQHAEQMC